MVEEGVMEHVTSATAGAAIVSPLWIMNTSHDGVVFLLPFLGFTWIAIQIYYKLKKEWKPNGS
jgi:hypothetical protein